MDLVRRARHGGAACAVGVVAVLGLPGFVLCVLKLR